MRSTQTGSSLVEVMLASALGLFLTFGFIQVYLSVQKTYHLQQAIIQAQENGRFAMHFLYAAVRTAGYANCDPENSFVKTDKAIMGYRQNMPAFLKNKNVKKNTDILQIGACILQNNKTTFEQSFFFIGATERKNALGNTIYALYTAPSNNTRSELVSGIENMHITYGVVQEKTDPDIARYVTADAVEDWEKVRAVKIALLLSSDFPVLTQPESYMFAETAFPADRFLHRSWYGYIALRNMQ